MTLFASLQAQPTLGFGGMGFVTWSGRTSAGAPYVPGVDSDSHDTYHTSTGDICIPDNAGTISIPLGAIYPRFPAGLGGYSTFPLHPMLGKGIAPHGAVYDYEVTCRYDILPYADPDPDNVSATAATDYDVATNELLTFTYPKCGYQDGYQNEPFEAGTRVATLTINVHGIGKFFPQFGPTANKNRFKVRFHTPIGMNLPGFTDDTVATSYELTFRIIGTTRPPVYWQDYGTIDCGHVRGHIGLNDVSLPGSIKAAGFASGYNPKVAELTLPFTSEYKRIHPNGADVMDYRDWLSYPDLDDPTDNGKRYLGMEVDVTRWVGWHNTFQDYNTTLPSLPSGVPIAVVGKVVAPPSTDVFVTHPGEYSGVPTLSFAALKGPPFAWEVAAAGGDPNYYTTNPPPVPFLLGAGTGEPPTSSGLAGAVDTMIVVYSSQLTFVTSGGTGYTKGDVLTLDDGTAVSDCHITVTSVDGSGVILTAQIKHAGEYDSADLPSGSVTGGTGTGASFAIHYGLKSISISSVGTGYDYGASISYSSAIQLGKALFNNPSKASDSAVITMSVNRYSSLLLDEVSSENYNLQLGGLLSLPIGNGAQTPVTVLDQLFFQLERETLNQYGHARYPNPQHPEFVIETTPSGLEWFLPQTTGYYDIQYWPETYNYGPVEKEYTDVIHFRKTNEYTVAEFEDDFDILRGVATPEFGKHKAVMFEADATDYVRDDAAVGWFESTGVYSYQDVDGRSAIIRMAREGTERFIGVNMTAAGSGYTSVPDITNDCITTYYEIDTITIADRGDNYIVGGGVNLFAQNRRQTEQYGVPITINSITPTGTSGPFSLPSGQIRTFSITGNYRIYPTTVHPWVAPTNPLSGISTYVEYFRPDGQMSYFSVEGSGAKFDVAWRRVDVHSVAGISLLPVLKTTSVDSLTLDDAGDFYTVEPAIRIEGGGGTGATAHVDLVPTEVDQIIVTHPGTGFTSIPAVTVSGSATAVAVLKATAIDDVTITDPGRGYIAIPTVTFTPTGASVVQVTLKLVPQASPSPAVIVAAPGTGYTVGDLLYFGLGSDLVTASVLQVDSVDGSGGVLTASIASAGSWTIDPPANPMGSGQGGTGTGATFNVKWGVNTVSGPNQGDYLDVVGEFGGSYQDIPTVAFVGACDVAASATAVLKCTSVESVTVASPGSGYTARPTVSFSGGGGVQAQAVAALVGTPIALITLDSGGSGYTSAPSVSFGAYGIVDEAEATAVLAGRGVDRIEILSPVGAANPMTLIISGGGGTGATADPVFETARIDETDTTPMTSGVATWAWGNAPSGVPVVFTIEDFPAIPNPPDYSTGEQSSPYRNTNEGAVDPSLLNQTAGGALIAGNFYGILNWYSGIPQIEIDERLVYRWQRRGIIGSGNTYIGQEYPVKVNAVISTFSWQRGSHLTPGTYPYFRPSVLIGTRRVDITEMASYIVEPPAPQVGYEDGGYCTCSFEYVVQDVAAAPGFASYP